MTVHRMDHVGVIVDDLAAATAFFAALGLEEAGAGTVEGSAVDRIVGLEGVVSDFAFMQTPDGHGRLELIRFRSPAIEDGDPRARPTRRASATWPSRSTTSTPPWDACRPTAANSWARS